MAIHTYAFLLSLLTVVITFLTDFGSRNIKDLKLHSAPPLTTILMKPGHILCGILAVFSATTLVLFTTGMLCVYISTLQHELESELDQLKLETDHIWQDMVAMGGDLEMSRRVRRDLGEVLNTAEIEEVPAPLNFPRESCLCFAGQACPPGPPGPTGEEGPDGRDGVDGVDGYDGFDAHPSEPSKITKGCFFCPPGEPGPQGPAGAPGKRGLRGAQGRAGRPGNNGQRGFPGDMGSVGPPGPDGEAGEPGPNGIDGVKYIPRQGVKGIMGEPGLEGAPGFRGRPGTIGKIGEVGYPGIVGMAGMDGAVGGVGQPGPPGPRGEDALYCGCQSRESQLETVEHEINTTVST
ncbi:hypothetical protein Y032_0184g993 [Ancylostoma ceylanicum]|uniref:Nematode cuticle collagen N-terminal domain-containing protein n=2 Tax=Ancylostoma ceylanicum TaxID=53326 RepID=A0A016SSD2_9BILA|nr:hypothetical protein Y032_0184g993 [Ancylostoma ceylanicum]